MSEPLRQRDPRQVDKKHIAFLQQQPCCVPIYAGGPRCGRTDVQAAHIRVGSINDGKRSTGMGERPHDKWALPVCCEHHAEQHAAGDELAWWASKGVDPFLLAISYRS